jgi:Zn-dependent protease with chaperone function
MKLQSSIFILLSALSSSLSAQFDLDYKMLHSSTTVPSHYVVNVSAESESLAAANKVLKPASAQAYFMQVLAVKKMLIESGNVYLPNTLTNYLDSVTAALLEYEPSNKQAIHVYLTRYSSSNAFSLADGSIFLNIGLFNQLANESELAFVIAHEMAHYVFQHNIKDFLKASAIQQKETYSAGLTDQFRKLRFSRESEQEADSYALSLINTAGFDPNMAESALEKLKPATEKPLIDYKALLNNSFFTLDTILVTKETIAKVRDNLKNQDAPDSQVDDLFETHPDIDKRMGSVRELQRNLRAGAKTKKVGKFESHRLLSDFELCGNYYRDQDYLNTVLQSVSLLKQYPNNNFLLSNMAASFYWLSYFKELSNGDLHVFGDLSKDPLNFCLLYLLYDKMTLKDSKQLAYAFLRSREDKIDNLETPFFYLAVTTENYLGKIAARDFYKRYESRFPNGSQMSYVKTKTQ